MFAFGQVSIKGELNIEHRTRNFEFRNVLNGGVIWMQKRVFDLEQRLLRFSVRVCEIAELLPTSSFLGKHVANQLVRSGTSPAPNYGEAQSAESRRDFIHKMKICLKELRETHIWLQFIQLKEMADTGLVKGVESEANELISIFVKSIETAKANLNRK